MRSRKSITALVDEYLAYRRSLGFQFRDDKDGGELRSFGRYADEIGHKGPLTVDLAVEWAGRTKRSTPIHRARRYHLVRDFFKYRALFDPGTEVPPKGLLGTSRYPRKPPYIYSDVEIGALMKAALTIRPKNGLRPRTYSTIFGLLACTGLRISEALSLANNDVNLDDGLLTIIGSKFKKSRLVPLHPSTANMLRHYSDYRNRHHTTGNTGAFFLGEEGKPLNYFQILHRFQHLRRKLDWKSERQTRLPRIHDLRHTFAVRRLLLWYKDGTNIDQKIPALATYLGHVNVTKTYWYLTAVPELLAIVGSRFEQFALSQKGGRS